MSANQSERDRERGDREDRERESSLENDEGSERNEESDGSQESGSSEGSEEDYGEEEEASDIDSLDGEMAHVYSSFLIDRGKRDVTRTKVLKVDIDTVNRQWEQDIGEKNSQKPTREVKERSPDKNTRFEGDHKEAISKSAVGNNTQKPRKDDIHTIGEENVRKSQQIRIRTNEAGLNSQSTSHARWISANHKNLIKDKEEFEVRQKKAKVVAHKADELNDIKASEGHIYYYDPSHHKYLERKRIRQLKREKELQKQIQDKERVIQRELEDKRLGYFRPFHYKEAEQQMKEEKTKPPAQASLEISGQNLTPRDPPLQKISLKGSRPKIRSLKPMKPLKPMAQMQTSYKMVPSTQEDQEKNHIELEKVKELKRIAIANRMHANLQRQQMRQEVAKYQNSVVSGLLKDRYKYVK